MAIITLPGKGGSDDDHWQSKWERTDPEIIRFSPSSWDQPDLSDWAAALDRAVASLSEKPILVAHSLGCLLIAHQAKQLEPVIAGAFLVGVPNPERPDSPVETVTFKGVPVTPLPFPAIIIASSDDPYGSMEYAKKTAAQWQTEFVDVGALGHITSTSGLDDWPQGQALLKKFQARVEKLA